MSATLETKSPVNSWRSLCSDATQGIRFVPNSQSRAQAFNTQMEATIHANGARRKYKGLSIEVERIAI